jgi:hypothetical protein
MSGMAPHAERPLTCDEVPALVRTFVAHGLSNEEGRHLRAHVAGCGACRAAYRDGVETAAHIGHERRIERVATEKAVRRWSLRKDIFSAHAPPRGRGARIRTLVYPAFFCFLIVQFTQLGTHEPMLEVEVLAGKVHASEALELGELCATGPEGRARLSTDGAWLELGNATRLLVESIHPPRVRLLTGELELDGGWHVTTRQGVVEVEGGRTRVALQPQGLVCAGDTGALSVIDARGETRVAAGERVVFGRE